VKEHGSAVRGGRSQPNYITAYCSSRLDNAIIWHAGLASRAWLIQSYPRLRQTVALWGDGVFSLGKSRDCSAAQFTCMA